MQINSVLPQSLTQTLVPKQIKVLTNKGGDTIFLMAVKFISNKPTPRFSHTENTKENKPRQKNKSVSDSMAKAGEVRATVVQRRKRSSKKGFNGRDRS